MGETAPDGNKDENVFDIRQDVAIVLLIIRAEVIAMGERQAVNTSAILTEAERRLPWLRSSFPAWRRAS